MRTFLPALALLLTASACEVFVPSSRFWGTPMFVVQNLEPRQLAGTWYEVASFPQRFQEGCGVTTATYSLAPDGRIGVLNRCEVEGQPGVVREIAGTARLQGPGQFEVRLDGVPLPARFWVLYISRDGRMLVVGNPGRFGGWVLRRDRSVTPEILDNARAVFERNGYDVAALQRTPLR
jgi:apolipoprotein D and lipocalin family protein